MHCSRSGLVEGAVRGWVEVVERGTVVVEEEVMGLVGVVGREMVVEGRGGEGWVVEEVGVRVAGRACRWRKPGSACAGLWAHMDTSASGSRHNE
jgi:hypothetical protein